MDTFRLDLELPLQSQVSIQDTNGIRLGLVTPDPTGCAWAARVFDLYNDGRGRDGDLGVREALGRLRETECRRRYGRQNALARYNGLLTIAVKDLAGAGRTWMGRYRRGGGRAGIEEHILG